MIACMFEGRYDVLFPAAPHEAWDSIYVDYIDLSGLADTPEYNLIMNIHNIEGRQRSIPGYVSVQLECIQYFGKLSPVITDKLAKKGHVLPSDIIKAREVLLRIPIKEKIYEHKLKEADSSLKKLRDKRVIGTSDAKRERGKFIRMLNNLGTIYTIDRNKTTVEELAQMVRETAEQKKAQTVYKK